MSSPSMRPRAGAPTTTLLLLLLLLLSAALPMWTAGQQASASNLNISPHSSTNRTRSTSGTNGGPDLLQVNKQQQPTTAGAAPQQTVTRGDAASTLFGASSSPSSLPAASSGYTRSTGSTGSALPDQPQLTYETLRLVPHPSRAQLSLKKVQQTHQGIPVFGHTFVVGVSASGEEQAEGTYGTAVTGLDTAVPDVTPVLSEQEAILAFTSRLVSVPGVDKSPEATATGSNKPKATTGSSRNNRMAATGSSSNNPKATTGSSSNNPKAATGSNNNPEVVTAKAKLYIWLAEAKVQGLDTFPSTKNAAASSITLGPTTTDLNTQHRAHLAYLVDLTFLQPTLVGMAGALPESAHAFVDATTGEVLQAWVDQRKQHVARSREYGDQDGFPWDNSEAGSTGSTGSTGTSGSGVSPKLSAQVHASRRSLSAASSSKKQRGIWAIGGNERTGPIHYNCSSFATPELVVTETAEGDCMFANNFAKTGDPHAIDYSASPQLGGSWEALGWQNLSNAVDDPKQWEWLYKMMATKTVKCPAKGQYAATNDTFAGAYSQDADVTALMPLVLSMWQDWLGVNVNAVLEAVDVPTPLLVIPHFDPALESAGSTAWYIFCGDAFDSRFFYPLCTGDVLAYAVGDMMTRHLNARLIRFGQSGGWSTAFSNFAAMTYIYYTRREISEYVMGDAVRLPRLGLVNMRSGSVYGDANSVTNASSLVWDLLAGPPNQAFYALSITRCFDPKVAMRIAQHAANLYFTPITSFHDGAQAWIHAAKDLGYPDAPIRKVWSNLGLWQVCGAREEYQPGVAIWTNKNGAKGKPIHIGNLSSAFIMGANNGDDGSDFQYADNKWCGVSFNLVADAWPPLPGYGSMPDLYVGMDQKPDMNNASTWACVLYAASHPSMPSCDVPLLPNVTYFVTAMGQEDWKNVNIEVVLWGPTATAKGNVSRGRYMLQEGGVTPAVSAAEELCFLGGACQKNKECESGRCKRGYCEQAKTGRRAASF